MMNNNMNNNNMTMTVETVFNTNITYTPSEMECETMIERSEELLNQYFEFDRNDGLHKMFDQNGVFWKRKGWLISEFKKHPFYNGNYQIVLKNQDMCRHFNEREMHGFFVYVNDWIHENAARVSSENGNIISHEEFVGKIKEYRILISKANSDEELSNILDRRNEFTREYANYSQEFDVALSIFDKMEREIYRINEEDQDAQFVMSEDFEKLIKSYDKNGLIKGCHAGIKLTKVVGKIAKLIGINKHVDIRDISFFNQDEVYIERHKDMGWNYQYAKFCDAVNPIKIKGTAVISVNPIDYWTMSFGNSWASCHTIDKKNKRRKSNGYSGMYCGGTESYMLDSSSVVFYFLSNEYNGDRPEIEDKVKRCMFYLGEDKLIQSRVYPDGRDGGDKSISADIRAIMQKVVSDIWNVPNYWHLEKGTDPCYRMTNSEGPHYRDYLHYEDCNVSFMKRIDSIGSEIICPSCGEWHETEDNIFCEYCSEDVWHCASCGERISEDDAIIVDGEPYCSDCVTYCDCCNEYVRNCDSSYINGEDICDWCRDLYYVWSDHENDYVHEDDAIETEEGNVYSSNGDGWFECCACGRLHDQDNVFVYDDEEYCEDCDEEIDLDEDED